MSKQLMGQDPAANALGFCLVGIPFAAACVFREQVRTQYGIGGHPIIDGVCAIFCLPCSLCQIHRQLKAKHVMHSTLKGEFSSGLHEFYEDVPTTLIVCVAPCVAFGILRRKMGQDCIMNTLFGFCAVWFIAGCMNRGAIRARYNLSNFPAKVDSGCDAASEWIKKKTGELHCFLCPTGVDPKILPLCNSFFDLLLWTLVPWCALVQEMRMVRRNKYAVAIIVQD